MINTLIGIKGEMTSGYDTRGRRTGVTKIVIEPNIVTQVKTQDGKDGYNAIQLGMGIKKSVAKPQQGHFAKANAPQNLRYVKEVRSEEISDLSLGTTIKVNEVFHVGDLIKVTGVSKGKGFQGGVRRHGFHGGPKTHGQSDRHRAPGSSGTGTTPGRVLKGKRMAGHMGVDTVTTRNLEVVSLDKAHNMISVKGSVPGARGALVTIHKLGVVKGYVAPVEIEEEVVEEQVVAEEATPAVEEPIQETAEQSAEGAAPATDSEITQPKEEQTVDVEISTQEASTESGQDEEAVNTEVVETPAEEENKA